MSILNATPRRIRRAAPCGAELTTNRQRRLAGAALYRRVEAQLRKDLEPWGLPLDAYGCSIESQGTVISGWFYGIAGDVLTATFTHRETGAAVVVTEIWVDDDGMIVQSGSNYGNLTL